MKLYEVEVYERGVRESNDLDHSTYNVIAGSIEKAIKDSKKRYKRDRRNCSLLAIRVRRAVERENPVVVSP